MTVGAVPLGLDPLITEAKERARRRRLLVAAILALLFGTAGVVAYAISEGNASSASPRAASTLAIVPRCNASALTAGAGFQGATQSLLGGMSVTNTGGGACVPPPGRPIVEVTLNGAVLPVRETPFPYRFTHGPSARLLTSHQSATVYAQWWNWCGGTGVARMSLRFPNGLTLTAPQPVGEPQCIDRSKPSRLFVSRPFVKG
jgi:hypothetical protein